MATQDSLIKLKGAIEDLAFFKSRDGHQARRKSGVNGQRIATDPAFQRTRENGAEFGHSGRAGKHFRKAIRSLLMNVSDRRMVGRLTQAMMQVVKSDTVSLRGERNVLTGDLRLLTGFEFNLEATLERTMLASFDHSLDRATGSAVISIAGASTEESLRTPDGATHIRFVGGITAIDFVSGSAQFAKTLSSEIDLATDTLAPITLNLSLPSPGTLPMFLLLGTEFYQLVNGRYYGLRNGAFNALSLIEVAL